MVKSVTVRAPCSTANLGPGFDVFGLALDAFYDEVTVKKKGKEITIISVDDIPLKPEQNTAGLVAKEMKKRCKISGGIEITIKKNVPAGFGMGSSAASAAACAIGINKLYNLKLSKNELVSYAGIGEKASAGSIHYDNVAASVIGGFVIVSSNPLNVVRIDAPKDLVLCVAIPDIKVPKKKTKVSRSVIPKSVKLSDSVKNLANAANIVAGFLNKDSRMIGESVIDVIVEPARKHMIPGFDNVKKNAMRSGAFGVTISGAGPSVIAFVSKKQNVKKIGDAMRRGFKTAKKDSTIVVCKPSKGPIIK
jgi:homoserine kinase